MYEKPELTLIGSAADVVLGPVGQFDDSDMASLEPGEGLVLGLDD
jgi:hypothetical protein